MPSPVSASSTFGDIIANTIGARVSRYDRVADLKWVGEPHRHIRTLVHFQAMKGATYSGRWGFSVDFVPVLSGPSSSVRRLASKRTAKAAVFDLCLDPIDSADRVPEWCSFDWLTPNPKRIAEVGAAVFESASRDFSRVADLRDLRSLFEQRSKMNFRRFSLSNYIQTDLCWGLVCIACGDEQEGMSRINAFCGRFSVDPHSKTLLMAIETARSDALRG